MAGTADVNISTPAWKAAMDNMFTQIDEIKNELDALNSAVNQFAVQALRWWYVPPPPPRCLPNGLLEVQVECIGRKTSTIKGKIAKITTELNLMKQ